MQITDIIEPNFVRMVLDIIYKYIYPVWLTKTFGSFCCRDYPGIYKSVYPKFDPIRYNIYI